MIEKLDGKIEFNDQNLDKLLTEICLNISLTAKEVCKYTSMRELQYYMRQQALKELLDLDLLSPEELEPDRGYTSWKL